MTLKALIALGLAAATASVSAGPWNEAVRTDAAGRRNVELPPQVSHDPRRYPPDIPRSWAPDAVFRGYLVEGPDRLMECVVPFYWAGGACTPFVPQQYRRARAWIVKRNGRWLQCPEQNSQAGCAALHGTGNSLPPFKVQ
jgi:hypothetical protein